MKKILLCAVMVLLSATSAVSQNREADIRPAIPSLDEFDGRQVPVELNARNVIRRVAPDEANQYTDEQGIVYQLNEGGESYMVYDGQENTMKEIVIPSEVNGLPVTSIDENTFAGNTNLTSIKLPYCIVAIGQYAFYGCSSLTSITIPEGVTSIGRYAFSKCSGLTSVTLPSSVTSIGEAMFWLCTSLTSFTIPNSVTSIGQYVFYECSGLTSITIPGSVTSIGEAAFRNCI